MQTCYYTVDELTNIVIRSANILGAEIEHRGAMEIAKRSRENTKNS